MNKQKLIDFLNEKIKQTNEAQYHFFNKQWYDQYEKANGERIAYTTLLIAVGDGKFDESGE